MIEEVESFPYLGSEIGQSTVVEKEVAVRVKKASTVFQMLRRTIFRNQNLSKSTKVCVWNNRDACSPLRCRDMASGTEGHPKTDNFPDAVPARYHKPHSMGQMP